MTDGVALIQRAEALFQQGNIGEAASLLEQAVTQDPVSARVWSDLGTVRFALGDAAGADDAFASALAADPDFIDALMNRSRIRIAQDRPEDAAPWVRHAQGTATDDPDIAALVEALGLEDDTRPVALLLDWDRTLRGERMMLRAVLEELGYRPRSVGRDVVDALATVWSLGLDATLGRLLDAVVPTLVISEQVMDDAAAIRSATRDRSIPLVNVDEIAAADADTFATTLQRVLADLPPMQRRQPIDLQPVLSLIVPTFERPVCLRNLLDRLTLQDLPPQLFEVIVVDDGSQDPVTTWLSNARPPYRLNLRWQENAGPARARNVAISLARAPYLLILNDDALPARDVARRHLVAQAASESPIAVLGSFDFDEDACADPFTDLMQHSTLLFEYGAMTPGKLHGGRFFWTCNLSVPKASVDAVGGFDEEYRHAICEDCDLGYRLEDEGVLVRYDPRIRSWHDHDMSLPRYLKRQRLLGRYWTRLFTKRPDLLRTIFSTSGTPGFTDSLWLSLRRRYEEERIGHTERVAEATALVNEAGTFPHGSRRRRELLDRVTALIARLGVTECFRGMLQVHYGDAICTPPEGTLADCPTSIVIPNLNGFPHVKDCVATLREHTDGPYELIIIDNGSSDGSLEWLREQPDVTLLEMGENIGAPAARNAGLQVATGGTIVFSDNDVMFTPRWRELLIAQLESWPDIGIVGPMSDYVSGSQKTEERERKKESLDAFARRFTKEHAGEHLYSRRLILFFMMCRRELIDRIGGIDPIYGRWGYEDDDLCLRTRIAGYEMRVAKDCFIRHLGSRTAKTANLDYDRFLVENFEVYKKKWGLDPTLCYGDSFDIGDVVEQPFDPALHHVPLTAGVPAPTCAP
ncbi:MAG: glycosyltransferase [Planctomycetes bacterium]|nr:glycosyltransferase [Planctomycetota bacterium]